MPKKGQRKALCAEWERLSLCGSRYLNDGHRELGRIRDSGRNVFREARRNWNLGTRPNDADDLVSTHLFHG
jgi:hypothetical protein